MAPVMSSVTVACCVRSPSATVCSSFINRRMAAWLASLTRGLLLLAFGFLALRSASCALRLVTAHTGAGNRRRRDDHRGEQQQCREAAEAEAGLLGERFLQRLPGRCAAVRCRRRSPPAPRAQPDQALQVAQNGAGLRAGLLVLQQRDQALRSADPWSAGRRSSWLPSDRPGRSRGTSSGPCPAGTPPRATRLPWSGIRWPTCRCAASA